MTSSAKRHIGFCFRLTIASTLTAGSAFTASARSTSEPSSVIKFELGIEHNSNASRSDAARAAARGLERADQRITPSIQIDLSRALGQTQVSLNGSAGYDLHARNTQLNRERVDLEFGVGRSIGPCKIDLLANAARRQSDLGDIAFVNGAISSVVKNAETRLQYGADISCGREYGFRPTAHVDYLTARNSNILRDRAEFGQLEYRGGIEYSTPNFGRLLAFVGRRDISLLNQPAAGGGKIGYNVTTIGARYARDIGSRLNAEATVGESKVGGGGALIRNASGVTWNVKVTAQLGERLQVTGSTGRQFTNSLSSDAAFLRSQTNQIELRYALNERMRLQAGYSNIGNRYDYASAPTGVFISRDRRKVLDAGLTYDVGRRWQFGLAGGHERRNANGRFFDFAGTFARATVSFTI